MVYLRRFLDLESTLKRKSIFLFGPRQTGKTSYLKACFKESPFYNLLLANTFTRLSQRPQIMREELLAQNHNPQTPIIIDEIQKLPILLDEAHDLIEEKKFKFILTGSSARKLKRRGANLLGGRARLKNMFPLVSQEIPNIDYDKILNLGALPSIYFSKNPEEDLADYIGLYLKEEIQAEGLTRNIGNFSRFLQTASLVNAELLNYTSVGSDAGVPSRTVIQYFEILQDTLIGHIHNPFTKTKKRKAISTGKFYFFDVGVCNQLAGRKNIKPKTDLFGKVLEHFIFTELKAFLSYTEDPRELYFWRSKSGFEVDFLLADEVAIEVKGTDLVSEKHLKGLKALSEDLPLKKKIIVSNDPHIRKIGDIVIYPLKDFLAHLWGGHF